jgi:putative transposase
VLWYQPKTRPTWLARETLAALPGALVAREVRYRIGRPGFRTREITLVTTLLDAAVYRVADLAELYRWHWRVDEVFLTINGRRHDLWRAVDQDDNVLDILVQSRRNKKAAKKFFRKLLKGLRYVPRVVILDKLKSYGAAKREMLPGVAHRQSRYLNNRCENSHRPTRQRERRMQGFKSPGHANVFCRRMDPLPNTSDPGGIGCQRRHTAKRWGIDSRVGPKLQAWSELPNGWVGPGRGTRLPDKRLNLNNLTKPLAELWDPAAGGPTKLRGSGA